MEKVLLTTYRKLHKMSYRVDASVAMRSVLSCAPLELYDHRRGEWSPVNVAKASAWTESRCFLDSLIRRLNSGRQFYVPGTTEEERVLAEAYMGKLRAEAARQCVEETAAAAAAAAPPPAGGATPTSAAESDGPSTATPASSSVGSSAARVPLTVAPYDSLRKTLRQLFESTPFSMANLTNGFAAVKELSYVCEVTDRYAAGVVGMSEPLRALPQPTMVRVLAVDSIHHVRLIKGLTEEIMASLRSSRRSRRRKASRAPDSAAVARGSAAAVAGDVAAAAAGDVAGNSFDEGPTTRDTPSPATEPDSEERFFTEDFGEDEGAGAGAEAAVGDESLYPSVAAASAAAAEPLAKAEAAMPPHVQLLLAHPQLSGFFRHSVMLVVRNAKNESAAFILNKPLENDEGLRMPVNATIRLSRVHPIFSKHLRHHTVMVGGPVMVCGAFDESVFLLHSVPGIPSALPLGDGLWLDGDYDQLMAKIQSGEASARDVVVICGFSGWGVEQLKGEVASGTWIIASGAASDRTMTGHVMNLAIVSGAHAAPADERDPFAVSKAAANVAAAAGAAETGSPAAASEAAADPAMVAARVSSSPRTTAAWVWSYELLGEPIASLAKNQKPEFRPEFE